MQKRVRLTKGKKIALFVTGFIISCLLVPVALNYADNVRGYDATGSEVLIPLLYILLAGLIKEIGGVIDGQL